MRTARYTRKVVRLSNELRISCPEAARLLREAEREKDHCPFKMSVYQMAVQMHENEKE